MSDDQGSAAEPVQRQVRVQLTSKQEDISLPESTGPILVPTGKNNLKPVYVEDENVLMPCFPQACDVMRCRHW